MAGKNINMFDEETLTPTMRIVAAPTPGTDGPPVLIDPAELEGAKGDDGDPGESAYQIAVQEGFVGTEAEWLDSLRGGPGDPGLTAYQVALDNGFSGTEAQWLDSLVGPPGVGLPGPQGELGPSIVPNEYTNAFNEAKVSQIATANVEWNIFVLTAGDTRANNTVPAALNGDMSGHLLRYEPGGTWRDLGIIVGVAGPTGPAGPGAITTVINSAATNLNLALTHAEKYLRMTSTAAKTVNVPLAASVAFPFVQDGETTTIMIRNAAVSGNLTLAPVAGVTLNRQLDRSLVIAPHGTVALTKVGVNTWDVSGDLEYV